MTILRSGSGAEVHGIVAPPQLPPPAQVYAITDRVARTKPAFPSSWPVGTVIPDPVFASRRLRVTDPNTLPSSINSSFGGPSAGYQMAWSANATKFYVGASAGGFIPFTFDATNMTRARISGAGDGGLVLTTVSTEPNFSFVDDDVIYVSGQNNTYSTPIVRKFNFTGQSYTDLLDLRPALYAIGKTIPDSSYLPNIFSSEASPEKIVCMCPSQAGDDSYLVTVFEVNNPTNKSVLDTVAGTVSVNGGSFNATTGATLNIHLHGVDIDRSGRYVCLFTRSTDVNAGKAPKYIWDTQTNVIAAITNSLAVPPLYGEAHSCMGWGQFLNMYGPHPTPYDNIVTSWRSLTDVTTFRSIIKVPRTLGETYCDGHITWHNAKAASLEPATMEVYRAYVGPNDVPHNDSPWQCWDGEIISVPTNDIDTTVHRHCHHYSDSQDDNDRTNGAAFFYQPRANNSKDGKWCLFSSHGDHSLGTQLGASSPVTKRYDVFIVELRMPA